MKIGKLRIRPTRRGWVILAVVALILSTYTADMAAAVGRVRSGVKAGSVELGGKTHEEALEILEKRAQDLTSQPVELFAEAHRISVTPNEVGFSPDVERTLDDAESVGREGNFLVRLWHRVRALFATTNVGWVSTHNEKAARTLVNNFAANVDTEGHEAGIEARGSEMVPIGAVPGRRLDQDRAIDTIIDGLESWPRRSMELPISVRSRRTTIDDAREAAEQANEWIKAPITLTGPDGSRHFLAREELAKMIDAVPERSGLDWKLRVRFSPEHVETALGEEMKAFEQTAKDAAFSVGAAVSVVAGQAGRKFDAKRTAEQLADAARKDDDRVAEATFSEIEPSLTTEEAKALNIKELVSTFTTQHPCCQPRVTNIHKIADAVNNTIIKPGASFSLNGHVGRRTLEKGYVLAPMISDGEFKDDVGGGVSQFATTMFNAIFFGGYRFDTYQAHSYYISRYPAGREATISWQHPDLAFTNNSKSGILVRTSYSSTQITVSFYGDKEGKQVTAENGPRTNPTEPEEQRKANPALKPGEERVAQGGGQGFTIQVKRIIRQNGDETVQTFTTRYKAQPRIIEFGPGSPTPAPTQSPGASPAPGATGAPRQPATPPPVPD